VVQEDALDDAIRSGRWPAPAIDVFVTEPATDSRCSACPALSSPHWAHPRRGAGQGRARGGRSVRLALQGEFVATR
jgi:phosphoglycerate dehydrogenase-like enzyme